MAYEFSEVEGIQCRDGIFLVDWPAVHRIVRSYYLWTNINTFTKPKEIAEGRLFTKPVFTLDVDWGGVHRKTPSSTTSDLQGHREQLHSWLLPMSEYQTRLRQYWALGHQEKEKWNVTRRANSGKAMRAISQNVGRWENVIGATKFVRDASFGAVVIGGVAVSGGTGILLVTGGSIGKGVGKGQDVYYESRVKGSARLGASIASGTIEATMSLATAYIPGGGPAAQQGVVVFLDTSKSGAQALIEGKSLSEAVTDMGWSVAGFGVSKLMSSDAVQKRLGRMAFPLFWGLDAAKGRGMKSTLKLARDQTSELTKAGLMTAAKSVMSTSDNRKKPGLKDTPLAGQKSLLDKILERAIVRIGSVS